MHSALRLASRTSVRLVARSTPALRVPARHFSAATDKLQKVLGDELAHEHKEYQEPDAFKKLQEVDSAWRFESVKGSVMMRLIKDVGDKEVKLEWQLTQPYDPEVEETEQEHFEPTDFAVYIKNKADNSGMVMYCSTARGESHRFVIGNIQHCEDINNAMADEAYSGPDFEDLDERLQDALDEVLSEYGINESVCDFMDTMAVDKEQVEYIIWLERMGKLWK